MHARRTSRSASQISSCRTLALAAEQLPACDLCQLPQFFSSSGRAAPLHHLTVTCNLLTACALLAAKCGLPAAAQRQLVRRGFAVITQGGRSAMESACETLSAPAEEPACIAGFAPLLVPQLEAVASLLALNPSGLGVISTVHLAPTPDLAAWLSAACALANHIGPAIGQGKEPWLSCWWLECAGSPYCLHLRCLRLQHLALCGVFRAPEPVQPSCTLACCPLWPL